MVTADEGNIIYDECHLHRLQHNGAQAVDTLGRTAAEAEPHLVEAIGLVVRLSGSWLCGLIESHATSGRRGSEGP